MEEIKIKKIIVDKVPENCGECPFLQYIDKEALCPVCIAISPDNWAIAGNPYLMTYRRSDCKLSRGKIKG